MTKKTGEIRSIPSSPSSPEIDVDLRLDLADVGDQSVDDLLLVRAHAPVHGLHLGLGVRLDPGGDVAPGPNVAGLVVLELLLALALQGGPSH